MKQLEAHEVALHRIFSDDYSFQIPDYQRPYAWDTEQTLQLLDDLTEALERDAGEPYFLGSIVLVKQPDRSQADVIDGQQRLTTLTILVAVLRDLSRDADVASNLDAMLCQPGNKVRGLQSKPRLTLRKRDADFFRKHVQETGGIEKLIQLHKEAPTTDAQKSIQQNARALRAKLEPWTEEQRLSLMQMLSNHTFLVVVSTYDLDSAHRIFSVMNDRGLDLSPADIFKSKVIGDLSDHVSEEYARKWEDAEQALGRDGFADLFLHIRMIFAKERAKRELLKEFPEQVLDSYLPSRAKEFVDDVLVPYADAYKSLRDQAYGASAGSQNLDAWFKRLAQLDNRDWRAPAMWALRHRPYDTDWLDNFFRSLERLAASMFIRRVYTSPRSNRYAELLQELHAGKDLSSPAFDLTEAEKADTLTQLNGEVYLATKIRRYVLLRVDEVLAGPAAATYDHSLITVEHVLPQNPRSDSMWLKTFSTQERKNWTHRIANLVLLTSYKNSQAQNYDFATKKEKYFTAKNGVSNFALTTQVLNQQEWSPTVLESRQRELVGALSDEWALA